MRSSKPIMDSFVIVGAALSFVFLLAIIIGAV